MALRLLYSAVRGELDQALRAIYQPIAAAATGAIRDAADQVKREGRANIASAGFGRKWQNALRVDVFPQRGTSANAAALARHNIPYAGVFETGADIRGKPLLWIPITGSPARIGGQRLTPKAFIQQIGPLVPLTSKKGQPLLASPVIGRSGTKITVAKLRRGQSSDNARLQPIFVGIPAVHINARFNLQAVFQKAAAGLADGYLRNLKT